MVIRIKNVGAQDSHTGQKKRGEEVRWVVSRRRIAAAVVSPTECQPVMVVER
jgi:hypothetical protein